MRTLPKPGSPAAVWLDQHALNWRELLGTGTPAAVLAHTLSLAAARRDAVAYYAGTAPYTCKVPSPSWRWTDLVVLADGTLQLLQIGPRGRRRALWTFGNIVPSERAA